MENENKLTDEELLDNEIWLFLGEASWAIFIAFLYLSPIVGAAIIISLLPS